MFDFTQLDLIRERRPLVHCVSNIVTANDCANLALAVGASPMMAQAPEDIYGKLMLVSFIHRIRGEQKFDSLAQLREQLRMDRKLVEQQFSKDKEE